MPRNRRLFYLGGAIDRLGMLTGTADRWLNPEACDALADELEPLVRSLAEKIQARIPDLVLTFTLEDDPESTNRPGPKPCVGAGFQTRPPSF